MLAIESGALMMKKATVENLNSSLGDAVIKLRLQGKKQCIGMIQS